MTVIAMFVGLAVVTVLLYATAMGLIRLLEAYMAWCEDESLNAVEESLETGRGASMTK